MQRVGAQPAYTSNFTLQRELKEREQPTETLQKGIKGDQSVLALF